MRRIVSIIILLSLTLAVMGCRGSTGPDPSVDVTDPAAMAGAFEVVRAELNGLASPSAISRLEGTAGRRVFVCAYGLQYPPVCSTAEGRDLADSLRKAAANLRVELGPLAPAISERALRLKIDVVTKTRSEVFRERVERHGAEDIGLFGYWVEIDGRTSWVLPSEVLEQRLYSSSRDNRGIMRDRLSGALLRRNPDLCALPTPLPYAQLSTVSWVERDEPDESSPGIFRIYRLHDHEFEKVDEATLLPRIVWAADHLMSTIGPDGRMRYRYFVSSDTEKSSESLIRHCGATYALIQAYVRTKYRPYLRAAEAAMEFVFRQSNWQERRGPHGGGRVYFFVWEGSKHIHLGGAGLALLMIDQYVEATGDAERYLERARGLARYIVSAQRESGEFIYRGSVDPNGVPKNTVSAFYPGEAILGLARLYAYDRDPLWLATAVRGADWLIDVRDQGKGPRELQIDHWLMIALSYLHHFTGDERYSSHQRLLSRPALMRHELVSRKFAKTYPDYAGNLFDPPDGTAVATCGEGLAATLDTCAAESRDCTDLHRLLLDVVRHEMLIQYTPDRMWWPQNQAETFGGFAGGLVDPSIRCDFVQHNLSSLLGAERHIAARRGVVLPGGPQWTERTLRGERFAGVPPERMRELRAASIRYRGTTAWE